MAGFNPHYLTKNSEELAELTAAFERVSTRVHPDFIPTVPVIVSSSEFHTYVVEPLEGIVTGYRTEFGKTAETKALNDICYASADPTCLTISLRAKDKSEDPATFHFFYSRRK